MSHGFTFKKGLNLVTSIFVPKKSIEVKVHCFACKKGLSVKI